MTSAFEILVSSASVVTGLLSLVATLWSYYGGFRSERSKLQQAEEQRFQLVLESDDLRTVGSYLDDVVGKFNIYEYSSNPKVSKTVDAYLEKLVSFVGTEAQMEQQSGEPQPLSRVQTSQAIPGEFDKVLTELRTGETWNALARLRRHLEITLRQVAYAKDIRLERASSAGYLLDILLRDGSIPQDAYHGLKYAVSVCNRAVHGLDVGLDEAEKAVQYASIGLGRIRQAS